MLSTSAATQKEKEGSNVLTSGSGGGGGQNNTESTRVALSLQGSAKLRSPKSVLIDYIMPDLTLKQFEKYKINLNEIKQEEKPIASGAYGILYRGYWKEEVVAVKILQAEGIKEDLLQVFNEFRKEVSMMSDLHHENLVELKGYSIGSGQPPPPHTPSSSSPDFNPPSDHEKGGNAENETEKGWKKETKRGEETATHTGSSQPPKIAMIMEFMEGGDLYRLINDKENIYGEEILIKILFDIAWGMNFLHTLSPPLIHRDLKPPNILIKHTTNKWKYICKIADFGLSTRQYLTSLKERAVETPIWLAPEILSGGKYSLKSDVYAFAIICYELIERKLPYENIEYRFLSELEQQIIQGKRSDLTGVRKRFLPEISELIECCWHPNPNSRPSFFEIIQKLIKISEKLKYTELSEYIKLKISSSSPAMHKTNKTQPIPHQKSSKSSSIAKNLALSGKFIKKLQTNPPESVCSLLIVGNEIWSAHKNGDISIWASESGNLLRQIIAAHSRDIQTMILVRNRVWTGSCDGLIRIWRARSLDDVPTVDTTTAVKEGYLELGFFFFFLFSSLPLFLFPSLPFPSPFSFLSLFPLPLPLPFSLPLLLPFVSLSLSTPLILFTLALPCNKF